MNTCIHKINLCSWKLLKAKIKSSVNISIGTILHLCKRVYILHSVKKTSGTAQLSCMSFHTFVFHLHCSIPPDWSACARTQRRHRLCLYLCGITWLQDKVILKYCQCVLVCVCVCFPTSGETQPFVSATLTFAVGLRALLSHGHDGLTWMEWILVI